jgi:His/Glu/Gln/Arg/opine family amino acid ABC transporter permease subunit
MDFATVFAYLPYLLYGGLITIVVSVLSLFFGTLIGLGFTFLRLSDNRIASRGAWLFVWFVRGTPMLLQVFAVYYWLPTVGILLPAFTAGVVALSLNAGAYYVDIFRAAILTVPRGQIEAGQAIGMTPWQVMRRIVVPLALRPALPPYIGQAINVVKNTSLVSVISVQELTATSQAIYSSTYKVAEILGTAGVIYLLITTVLAVFQTWLEKRLGYYTLR